MSSGLLLATLLVIGTGDEVWDARAWARLTGRPTEVDLACAGYDYGRQWAVATRDGNVVVRHETPDAEQQDPLPFAVPRHKDRAGDRHVLRLPDGWLVGFDDGEFGGGLWFTATGKDWRRVRPHPNAPVNAEDPFRAENVRGFVESGGRALVLMGLDHLTGRSGRVFAVESRDGEWVLGRAAVLDSSPVAWSVAEGRLEVVTEAGLWFVQWDAAARLAVPLAFGGAFPRSITVDADGRRHIGMRRYVVILEPGTATWRETWYGPAACRHSVRDERGECRCAK